MSLVASLRNAAAQDQGSALSTYSELLARHQSPQPGDVESLRHVMAVLQLTPDHVAADLEALTRLQRIAGELIDEARIETLAAEDAKTFAQNEKAARKLIVDSLEATLQQDRIRALQDVMRAAVQWTPGRDHASGNDYFTRERELNAAWMQWLDRAEDARRGNASAIARINDIRRDSPRAAAALDATESKV